MNALSEMFLNPLQNTFQNKNKKKLRLTLFHEELNYCYLFILVQEKNQ